MAGVDGINDNRVRQAVHDAFWNDVLLDEESFLQKIKSFCLRLSELNEDEAKELASFFGRCYSNLHWQDTVKIFTIPVIKELMRNRNDQMRSAVNPALRSEYDKMRQLLIGSDESLSLPKLTFDEWRSASRMLSSWRRKVYGR